MNNECGVESQVEAQALSGAALLRRRGARPAGPHPLVERRGGVVCYPLHRLLHAGLSR